MCLVLKHLMEGGAPPPDMLVASLAFVPRGVDLQGSQELTRAGDALRLLALQNTGGKVIAAGEQRGVIPSW